MKHILFDLKECLLPSTLDDEEYVRESLRLAAEAAECQVLSIHTHKFEPQGVTGFALLAESHLSIHTWPEKNIAKCDIFTCSDKNKPKSALDLLKERFHACEVTRWACDRSNGVTMVL
tara:strand:- start:7060 stop:7413 length:354 start_codon:yes stop_codon:yes gene_type:complete